MNWNSLLHAGKDLLDLRLFNLSGTPVTIVTAFSFVVVLLLANRASKMLARGAVRTANLLGVKDESTRVAISRFVRTAMLVTGGAVAFGILGIDLSALFTAGAVFAVGIGLALQNVARDVVSGVLVSVGGRIKRGDIIELGDQIMRVKTIGLLATITRTLEDEEVIIPNGELATSRVKSFTHSDSIFRIRCQVGLAYDSDLDAVAAALDLAAENIKKRCQDKPPRVLLLEFGNNAVLFDVSIWIDDPWRAPEARSDLAFAVWNALKDANITIAFPQLDLHLDPSTLRP